MLQSFQAIRIEVNNELDSIQNFFTICENFRDKGRIVCITYHSLEDRLVKNFLKMEFLIKLIFLEIKKIH